MCWWTRKKRLSLDCALEQQSIEKAKQDDQAFEAMTRQSGTSAPSTAEAAAGSASPAPPQKKNPMQQQIRIYAVEKNKEAACKKNEHEATSGWCLVGQVRVWGSGLLKLNGFVFWVVEFGWEILDLRFSDCRFWDVGGDVCYELSLGVFLDSEFEIVWLGLQGFGCAVSVL